jgi:hypothetical protein
VKIHITIGGRRFDALHIERAAARDALHIERAAARDLVPLLPATMDLIDHAPVKKTRAPSPRQ